MITRRPFCWLPREMRADGHHAAIVDDEHIGPDLIDCDGGRGDERCGLRRPERQAQADEQARQECRFALSNTALACSVPVPASSAGVDEVETPLVRRALVVGEAGEDRHRAELLAGQLVVVASPRAGAGYPAH